MKAEQIIDALNFIDDDLLEEAQQKRFEKSNSSKQKSQAKLKRYVPLTIAASICVILVGAMTLETGDESLIFGHSFKGGAGCELGIVSYEDISTINAGNPYEVGSTELETLPVYKNLSYDLAGEPLGLDISQMQELLEKTAKLLNVDVSNVEIQKNSREPDLTTYIRTVAKDMIITVEADGLVEITLEEDKAFNEKTVEEYNQLLGYENPVLTKNDLGNYHVYDASGSLLEKILNYNFSYTEFWVDKKEHFRYIRIHNDLMSAEMMEEYSLISLEEAENRLYEGEFYTYGDYGISKNQKIVEVELLYINSKLVKNYIPYYAFYIEVEKDDFGEEYVDCIENCYKVCYVPAVELN